MTRELLSGLFPCLFPTQKPCVPRAHGDDQEARWGHGAMGLGLPEWELLEKRGCPTCEKVAPGGPRCGNEDSKASGGPSHFWTMAKACEHVDGSRARAVLPELSRGFPGPPARNTALWGNTAQRPPLSAPVWPGQPSVLERAGCVCIHVSVCMFVHMAYGHEGVHSCVYTVPDMCT